MDLSKRNAQQIVTEISSIIGESVNMMNADGIIIASTDSSRIGTFHEAAKKVVDEQLNELVIHGDDDYVGTKSGTNLPVVLNNEIIGVVGVTGPYQQVVKYGQIIKKMTEILLLERSYREQKELNENIRNRFVEEWICIDLKNVNHSMATRGLSLGIDITIQRRIMVMSPITIDERDIASTQKNFDYACKIINRILSEDKNNIMLKTATNIVCAVSNCNDKAIYQLATRIKNEVEQKNNIVLGIGIDTQISSYAFIHSSYLKAMKALQACLRTQEKEIRFYDNINMELFASEIPEMVKEEYIRKIFKGYSLKEIAQWVILLETFYKEEGSITATSEKLFIHKNTLQYKLKSLKEKTGYDPRSIHYSSLFYNAIYFYRDIQRNINTFGKVDK
ncbi:sugar diacid recognition domain-containing protein [Paludicola sp. MB14-C6]|uniref:CdaR family transcriptional regulator n=1 Tax=Paludihabitans sp. MB14-C6 TaxID=3070656 RepID=UPI0027DD0873|nr:sugar diacid recognition domain-containing protein [Paludicola sp. MB14-C6]WMJ22824.1 sugar diacid recognition domain-containing protein [Paludicola sp. MB14-C6]